MSSSLESPEDGSCWRMEERGWWGRQQPGDAMCRGFDSIFAQRGCLRGLGEKTREWTFLVKISVDLLWLWGGWAWRSQDQRQRERDRDTDQQGQYPSHPDRGTEGCSGTAVVRKKTGQQIQEITRRQIHHELEVCWMVLKEWEDSPEGDGVSWPRLRPFGGYCPRLQFFCFVL